jgi:UDP-N-acetylmuramate--alanine ligase
VKIHFIGIGGIGISGLAQYMDHKGNLVSGSDIAENRIVKQLKAKGIAVTIPHDASAIEEQELVVHSAIIRPDNVEVVAAKARGIEVLPRREALLRILQDKEVYAVAGAHGKSTTSAILAAIMEGSAIIGAESKAFGSNVRYDDTNDRLIFEADESDGSFLNSNPYCAIVTNAEPEHMEYYEYDYERFYDAYRRFIASATLRVLNAEDDFLATIEGEAIRLYPSRDISQIEFVLRDDEPHTRFTLKALGSFEVWGFGAHIALDASLAVLAAVQTMPVDVVREHILDYKGIKKRFDIIASEPGCVLIDDYGHHPTEIAATMASAVTYAKLMGLKTVTAVWQPHKYSRTVDNLDAFSHCFKGVDRLVILPVWAAGEEARVIDFEGVFAAYDPVLADAVRRSGCGLDVVKNAQPAMHLEEGLIIGFGAGDITYQLRGEK